MRISHFLALFLFLSLAVGSLVELHIYKANNPERHVLRISGGFDPYWDYIGSFNVWSSSVPGSVAFTYLETTNPLRGMVVAGAQVGIDGWNPKFTFYALTSESWCSCKVTISETGYGICGHGGAKDNADHKGHLNYLDNPHDSTLPDCTETTVSNDCKCSYSLDDWRRNFASDGDDNKHFCSWPNHIGYRNLDVFQLANPTERTLLCGYSWETIINNKNSDRWTQLARQFIATVLNFINGECTNCNLRPDTCSAIWDTVISLQTRLSVCTKLTDNEWKTKYENILNVLKKFNEGKIGPGECGRSYDDKYFGGGCCSTCHHKYSGTVNADSGDYYLKHTDSYDGKINYPEVTKNDPHRMLVSLDKYVVGDGWCPRLSFWSPCDEWEEYYY